MKEERRQRLMKLQTGISKAGNLKLVGETLPVLVEGASAESDLLWQGRLSTQAPDIDGVVYLNDGITDHTRPGDIVPVRINEAHPYDLVGTVVQ